jgi:hypothetical protein
MLYKSKNYCRSRISQATAENGDEFENCNFSRSVPHTVIFEGVTGLTFISCNLFNCDIPEDAEKTKCVHIHKSICSHIHPKRLAKSEIPECDADCEHVVGSDSITIDGKLIKTKYYYEDKAV